MKVLCDVHIAMRVVRFLESKNIEVVHVNNILEGDHSTDQDICSYADKHDYTVMTKDSDFKNSHFIQGTPIRLLKINLGNISTQKLIEILDKHLDLLIKSFTLGPCCVEIYLDRIEIHKT